MKRAFYRNLHILYPDDTVFSGKYNDSINKLFQRVDSALLPIIVKNKNKSLCGETISVIRLKNSNYLVVYTNESNKYNPYLFCYNAKTKEVTNFIDHKYFELLNKELYIGELDYHVKHMDYFALQSTVLNNIKHLTKTYDEIESEQNRTLNYQCDLNGPSNDNVSDIIDDFNIGDDR